jgi:hypothetical protein
MYSLVAPGAGMGSPCWCNPFEVKLHSFANEFFHLIENGARNAEAWKIGSIGAPLVHDFS